MKRPWGIKFNDKNLNHVTKFISPTQDPAVRRIDRSKLPVYISHMYYFSIFELKHKFNMKDIQSNDQ